MLSRTNHRTRVVDYTPACPLDRHVRRLLCTLLYVLALIVVAAAHLLDEVIQHITPQEADDCRNIL